MIIPIRCFTCGKVIADKWERFSQARITRGLDAQGTILTELGLTRACCRRMMLTHVDINVETIAQVSTVINSSKTDSTHEAFNRARCDEVKKSDDDVEENVATQLLGKRNRCALGSANNKSVRFRGTQINHAGESQDQQHQSNDHQNKK